MDDVTLAHAKEHLEELIDKAERGEDVAIAVPGRGVFRLSKEKLAERDAPVPILGQWKGRFTVPRRLFEPLTDDELRWLSGEDSP